MAETKTKIMIRTWADAPAFDFDERRIWSWPPCFDITANTPDQTPPRYVPGHVDFWREACRIQGRPAIKIMARYDGQTDCVEWAFDA